MAVYTNGKNTIEATAKYYNFILKPHGYKPVEKSLKKSKIKLSELEQDGD